MRVTSSHLVGRTGELAECHLALREAAAEAPSVIALSGDSGVGKTRLIAAFQAMAGEEARFLRGECVELGEGELPYGPLIGALRELARCGDPALERLSAGARSSLAALLPALGRTGGVDGEDDLAQLRLFEALLELLELLGEERPVVLVLEDLHWADRSTRAFTAFLARSLRRERVLFLFSYRADALHRRHPLRALVSELDHGERTRRVVVRPWGREELGEALADILGAPPGEELLTRVFTRAEGNPLYTEELLAAGLDGRGAAPQSLRDAFMLRIERLSPDAQRSLRALAVAGRADEELLGRVTGLSAGELTTALHEAIAAQVVEAGSGGELGFRHALLREVVYEELLPGERASAHLALARALDERRRDGGEGAGQVAALIATHAQAAGDRSLALSAAIAAADAASAIHAHGEAADLLDRAQESWAGVDDPVAVSGMDHVELLVRAGAEHSLNGQRTRAESMFLSALSELGEEGDPVRVATVLERLAWAQWALARGDEALVTARRALELLPVGRADTQRASVLAMLARTTLLRGRYREAVEAARAAQEIVKSSGAGRHLESQVMNTLGMALVGCGSPDEGIAELRAALELARQSGDRASLGAAYGNLSDVHLFVGRTRESLAIALAGRDEVPKEVRSDQLWLTVAVAESALALGDWELAARSMEREPRLLEGRWLVNFRLRQAELALGVGQAEQAERSLMEIEPLVERTVEPQFHASFGLVLADLHRRRGELELARAALQQALDRIELCTDAAERITAIAAAGVAVEADLAQRARDQGDGRALEHAQRCAEIHVDRVRAGAQGRGPVEEAWLATAEAELLRAFGRVVPDAWAPAVRAWDAIERPYIAAQLRLRQVEALAEAGDRREAARVLGEAYETAGALGATWLVAELEGLAARARLQLPLAEEGANDGEVLAALAVDDPFGLTPRELEVLRLVARGATNREIGAELYMAEKTASVHVSRILTKLDVRTRTQAAAVAHRAGLVAGHI
jgi:DNA-binding CsgD family transcriptional regulator